MRGGRFHARNIYAPVPLISKMLVTKAEAAEKERTTLSQVREWPRIRDVSN